MMYLSQLSKLRAKKRATGPWVTYPAEKISGEFAIEQNEINFTYDALRVATYRRN